MKFWNVHRTNAANLEGLLNAHALKGYELHHIRGVNFSRGDHLVVIFVKDVSPEDFATAMQQKAERATQRRAVETPTPAAEPVSA